MFDKWLRHGLVVTGLIVIGLVSGLGAVAAQDNDSADPLTGYWQKDDDLSFYIHVVKSDGVYAAEVIRSDWSPRLIGTQFFRDVVSTKKNRWAGEADSIGSDRIAKVSLRISRSGDLSTRLRPGGNQVWVRGESTTKP